MLRSINGSTARQDGTVARQRPRIFRQISCMYTEEKSLAAAPDRVHSQLKLEEDVPQEGASLGGAPGPLRLLLRKPSSASRPCVILSRPWTSPGWRRTLTHVRRRASRRSWSNVGGRGRLPAFSPRRTVVRERRILRRPAGCVQASHGLPPPYRTAGSVTSQMLAL